MELAELLQELQDEEAKPTPEKKVLPDPLSLSRIALRFGQEASDAREDRVDNPEDTEKTVEKAVFTYRGHILAWESDPPHIRLYAWAVVHLFSGMPLTVDIVNTARLLEVTPREVLDGLARLVKDGELVRTTERGRDFFRVNVRY